MSRVKPPTAEASSPDDRARPGRLDQYADLKDRGRQATLRGEFREAIVLYTRARQLAHAEDDPELIDEADLNVAMVLIQMGEARKGEEGLREILLRTKNPRVGVAAAYNIASSLRNQGRLERAMVYARRALERAAKLDAVDCLAMIHNLIGNLHLSQSYPDEALAEYRRALELRESQEGDTRYSRAIVLENLGYCLLLQQRLHEGTARIREALDLAREVRDRRCEAECLQDLCYGLLLEDRNDEAIRLGEAALELAADAGYDDIEENCHYLLGELGSRTDDADRRDHHFQRLQNLHPELPFLRDFLCAVDVTQIITLKR
jgi:tetratricopeptide (TPR) repeat protein